MKVTIDLEFCQGHAVCMGEAPEVFQVNDRGEVTVLLEDVPPELHEKVRAAEQYCPTGAVSVE